MFACQDFRISINLFAILLFAKWIFKNYGFLSLPYHCILEVRTEHNICTLFRKSLDHEEPHPHQIEKNHSSACDLRLSWMQRLDGNLDSLHGDRSVLSKCGVKGVWRSERLIVVDTWIAIVNWDFRDFELLLRRAVQTPPKIFWPIHFRCQQMLSFDFMEYEATWSITSIWAL